MNGFSRNQVVTSVTEPPMLDGDARILCVDFASDIVIFITIEPILRRPWAMSASEFSEWFTLGHVKIIETTPPKFMLVDEASIADGQKLIRDKRWGRISSLVSSMNPNEIFYPESMGKMVYSHA